MGLKVFCFVLHLLSTLVNQEALEMFGESYLGKCGVLPLQWLLISVINSFG